MHFIFLVYFHNSCQLLDLFVDIYLPTLLVFHIFKYLDENDMNIYTKILDINFEQPIYISKVEFKRDSEENLIAPNLLILIEQDEKQILPHKEPTETINLGIEKSSKRY